MASTLPADLAARSFRDPGEMSMDHECALNRFLLRVEAEIYGAVAAITSGSQRIHHAQHILESLESEVEGFETYMDHVQDVYQWLRLKRNEAQEQLLRLDMPFTSPVRRLSREILAAIFTNTVDTHEFSLLSSPDQENHAPLTLGQVCHSWREVALSTPRLWSSVRVEFPQNLPRDDEQGIIGLMELWMERSGDALLQIDFTVFPPIDGQPGVRGSAIRAVFAPLLRHSNRWRELHLDLSFGALKSFLKEDPFASGLQVPKLEIVELMGGRGSYNLARTTKPPFRPLFDFSSAQPLFKVSLFDVGLLAAYETAFPWQHLTELDLFGADYEVSFEDCSAIFRQCSSLKWCRLSISNSTRAGWEPGYQPIILEQLEWFHISQRCLSGGGAGDIYHHLICPKLCELTLEYFPKDNEIIHQHHSIWTRDAIAYFLSRSPLLVAFQIWNMPLNEECLIKVLAHAPLLTHLTVAGRPANCAGNLLLSHLSYVVGEDLSLKDLTYINIESQVCSEVVIHEFIKSRLRWGNTLKYVRLSFSEAGTPKVRWLHQLAKYEKDGLTVDVVGPRVGRWD